MFKFKQKLVDITFIFVLFDDIIPFNGAMNLFVYC